MQIFVSAFELYVTPKVQINYFFLENIAHFIHSVLYLMHFEPNKCVEILRGKVLHFKVM